MQVTRRWMLAALGAVAVTAGVLGAAFPVGSPNKLPRCLDGGIIAVEVAASPAELKGIWDQKPTDWRKNLEGNLYADFPFMAAYAFSFAMLGLAARQRNRGLRRLMGAIAIATGIAAAGFDVIENLRTLDSLSLLKENQAPATATVEMTRMASLAKWNLTGVTLLLLFGAFRPARRGDAIYRILAWLSTFFVLTAGVLAIWGRWDNPKIEPVIPCLAAGLLPFAVIAWKYWDDHMSGA